MNPAVPRNRCDRRNTLRSLRREPERHARSVREAGYEHGGARIDLRTVHGIVDNCGDEVNIGVKNG